MNANTDVLPHCFLGMPPLWNATPERRHFASCTVTFVTVAVTFFNGIASFSLVIIPFHFNYVNQFAGIMAKSLTNSLICGILHEVFKKVTKVTDHLHTLFVDRKYWISFPMNSPRQRLAAGLAPPNRGCAHAPYFGIFLKINGGNVSCFKQARRPGLWPFG